MSTATVNCPKKSQSRPTPAKWDDEKTKILLEVFEQEINSGNRPGGIYSKQAWLNIVVNFNLKTGLVYNKDQIKNRQDNLRREFTKWESLIGKETGLGWDHEKRTLAAPDSWWAEKARVSFYTHNQHYWKGVRVLEDKTRRIAFVKILDGGVSAVCRWLATFPDV